MNLRDIPADINWPSGNRLLINPEPGEPITPEERLNLMDEDSFEILVLQWASYYLRKEYADVKLFAGPGDKGRDIVCYPDPEKKASRVWDNFQCKHYDHRLHPGDIWPDIGKLCFYTMTKIFDCAPRKFVFVSPKGFGPAVQDLFQYPDGIKNGLISNYDTWVKVLSDYSAKQEAELKSYIQQFDFSIVDGLEPTTLLQQYRQTPFYGIKFGGTFKARDYAVVVPEDVDNPKEARYVEQLLKVYRERAPNLKNHTELSAVPKLQRHFNTSRKNFYKAESLQVFARDNYPGFSPFDELREQILDGVQPTLDRVHQDSLEKVNAVCEHATKITVDGNILQTHSQPGDKIGICHHLANDDLIVWVDEDAGKK